MPIQSPSKISLSCVATKAAKKSYPKWKSLIPLLQAAANEVKARELPEITNMKLGIVLMSDEELLEMNQKVMKHDFYTDILTFEIERTEGNLEAELYFSLDRASENALQYKVTLRNELARLAIHGMLHLAGYDDKKPAAKKKMRKKENQFLVSLRGVA